MSRMHFFFSSGSIYNSADDSADQAPTNIRTRNCITGMPILSYYDATYGRVLSGMSAMWGTAGPPCSEICPLCGVPQGPPVAKYGDSMSGTDTRDHKECPK